MSLGKLFLAGTAATLAVPALAAVTVVGSSSARLCYEAAESDLTSAGRIRYCDQALAQDALSRHDLVATHVNRGILLMRGGRLDAAIADFDRAIARDEGQAEAYLNKGVAMLKVPAGFADALPLFTTALEKKTRRPEIAYYGRAIAHEMTGDIRAAYRDYKLASSHSPSWDQPKVELSRFKVVDN
jgi:tetratricopeptide (TPR) repeat protein